MPVCFFPQVEFVWVRASAPPTARPAKSAARCKPKPPRKKGKPPAKKLTPQLRTLLSDRLEAAVCAGVIDLHDDFEDCEELCITGGEYALLLAILLPEEYAAPRRRAAPTATAPGSAERIAEYAARATAGRATTAPGDATAHRAGDRGLAVAQRKNGSGVRVVGWAEG